MLFRRHALFQLLEPVHDNPDLRLRDADGLRRSGVHYADDSLVTQQIIGASGSRTAFIECPANRRRITERERRRRRQDSHNLRITIPGGKIEQLRSIR